MMSGNITDVNMAIEEEYSKKSDSPALTEATSYTSSPEASPQDESKNGLNTSIRRKLFEDPPKDTIDSPVATSTSLVIREAVVTTPRGSETGISTTSSETTAIPSWNLSNASEKNVEVPLENFILSQPIPLMTPPPKFPLDKTRPILSSPSSFGSDESQPRLLENENVSKHTITSDDVEIIVTESKEENKPSLVMEDPPEEPSSCNAAMNIAEIVMAFGQSARQRYQGAEQTEKTESSFENKTAEPAKRDPLIRSKPPIITARRVSESSSQSEKSHSSARSMERERYTLNNKPNRDAYTIAKLQQAIDAQKQLNSLKEVEIVDKQVELQVLNNKIRTLQKEQEDYIERETELQETIKILKKELDKMTLLNSAPSDELAHLKLESESSQNQANNFKKEAMLAESQAKEQQARIEELERSMKEKEKENFDLQTKIDWLNDQNKDGKMDSPQENMIENAEPVQPDVTDLSANEAIEYRLKEIMKRLEAVEIEKQEIESGPEKESEEKSEEEKKNMKQIESEHDGVKINVSEDPDQIEAMTVKRAMAVKRETNINVVAEEHSTWCCGLIPGE